MSGRAFDSPPDFNEQLKAWLSVANNRISRSRRGWPSDLVSFDRAAMRGLPPVAREVMFRNSVRLPRDYYVRAFNNDYSVRPFNNDYSVRPFNNDYSVDPSMIGLVVDVSASLDTVTVHHDGVLIATHPRKWARQLTVTDPAHVLRAAELRARFQAQRARRPAVAAVVETASLVSYDELFLVDIDAPSAVLEVAS